MEAELLRGMIADRDVRMEKIRKKCDEQAARNVQLCQQLEEVSEQAQRQSMQISSEKAKLLQQYNAVISKLEQMQRDFKQQGASLKTYSKDTSTISKINGTGGDSSYVMRMQAQLCKAMHSLGITDHQMELAIKHTDLIVKYQKETLVQCREERTATELILMNQLIEKDNERRTIEDSYLSKLETITKERDALERQMEESGHDLDDDDEEFKNKDDDEEEDQEEKEIKEELMQLLTEKRSEIERLEQLLEEQEELILELEEQIADGGPGSGTMTQRKTQALDNTSRTSETVSAKHAQTTEFGGKKANTEPIDRNEEEQNGNLNLPLSASSDESKRMEALNDASANQVTSDIDEEEKPINDDEEETANDDEEEAEEGDGENEEGNEITHGDEDVIDKLSQQQIEATVDGPSIDTRPE